MGGAFYADSAGAAFDGFERVFDLEDMAVWGEDWGLSVGDWEQGDGLVYRRGRGRSLLMPF